MVLDSSYYAVLLDNSDFSMKILSKRLNWSRKNGHQDFIRTAFDATRLFRKGDVEGAKNKWATISESRRFTTVGRIIARIKARTLSSNSEPKSNTQRSLRRLYRQLDDPIAILIGSLGSNPSNDADLYKKISSSLRKNGYQELAKYSSLMGQGKRKHKNLTLVRKRHRLISNSFRRIGANDLSHQALGAYYLLFFNKEKVQSTKHYLKKSAKEFRLGREVKLYHYLIGNYLTHQARNTKDRTKKVQFLERAAEHLARSGNLKEYYIISGDCHFQKALLANDDKALEALRVAYDMYVKGNSKRRIARARAMLFHRKALQGIGPNNVINFKKASLWFKKGGNNKMHYHCLAQFHFASYGIKQDPFSKIRHLRNAAKYYKKISISRYFHRMRGLQYLQETNLAKDLEKTRELYRTAAREFRAGKWIQDYHGSLGLYYYISSIVTPRDSPIPLFLKCIKHLKIANNPFVVEVTGQMCFHMAIMAKSEKYAKTAIEMFEKSNNQEMLLASKMMYYEIIAQREIEEEKKREAYLFAATNMHGYAVSISKHRGILKGFPEKYRVEKISEKLEAQAEYYKALGSKEPEREDHFRNAQQQFQKLLSEENEDRYLIRNYAQLLRDWKKYDESHTILKAICEKLPNDTSLRKELDLAERLLKSDYMKTKEELEKEKNLRVELRQELMQTNIRSGGLNWAKGFFQNIVSIVSLVGNTVETKPVTFNKLDEEEMRDHFYSHLNLVFQGRATTETFRKNGKTDILVTNPDNLLENVVLEFKLWKGKKYYHKGITQILDYSIGKDKRGIFVTINKKHNWRSLLKNAEKAAMSHPNYVEKSFRSEELEDRTHFWCNYMASGRVRPIEIHHLLFDSILYRIGKSPH